MTIVKLIRGALLALLLPVSAVAGQTYEIEVNNRRFVLAEGLELELVAGPPLVDRPICADFDEKGRLYVADSSGSNEDVKIQLEKKPHRIVRLEDVDRDGRFDRRTVFADHLAFPEGATWHDGALYVAAPPEIWKLTDMDDDGVADQREVWFDGKTLTHCGNDLHGPYLGLDGWMYWCKGAFAEQTYERPGDRPLVTRAAHMFRRRPQGGPIEVVMTGGMDNPVEVVFTPAGERIFTTTFLHHPRDGKRDGLIHAIYGGVYGKDHGVLEGHLRTGDLMPVLSHMGAAAPCGLARLQTAHFGGEYQDNLLACLFNMHKVTRHVLTPAGGTFESRDEDFLVSTDLDFHPTDVLEDADGSVLVVDTGGWYKMCCPTSQLYKPDILGAIYRVRRRDAHELSDPRGHSVDWSGSTLEQLVARLADARWAVRESAKSQIIKKGDDAVPVLAAALDSGDLGVRLHAVWTLARLDGPAARAAVRQALTNEDPHVRQAAAHAAGLWRDQNAVPILVRLLADPSPQTRRAAAEAVGRVGDSQAVEHLLQAAGREDDRALEHSMTFALLEIGAVDEIRRGLRDATPRARRAALLALGQLEEGSLEKADVVPLLSSTEPILHDIGWWLLERRPAWAPALLDYFRARIEAQQLTADERQKLTSRLAHFAHDDSIQELIADKLADPSTEAAMKLTLLDAIAGSDIRQLPASWAEQLVSCLASGKASQISRAVSAAHALAKVESPTPLARSLLNVADNETHSPELRLEALVAALAGKNSTRDLEPDVLRFVCRSLADDQPVRVRSLAVDALAAAQLAPQQLQIVAAHLPRTGPMELARLLPLFEQSPNEQAGIALVDALSETAAAASLDAELLESRLAKFGKLVQRRAEPLLSRLAEQHQDKRQQIESVLNLMEQADARRGQVVFHSTKTACAACHQMGYLGGQIGPSLTRIGNIRSERDLVESILFPSSSFVRSYEPLTVVTTRGEVFNGVLRDETATELVLALDAQKSVQIPHDDVEERHPGTVSIMPAGLEKQLSSQQLADLVRFLMVSQ